MERTAAGYFRDSAAADAAIEALARRGFDRDHIVRAEVFDEPGASGGMRLTVHTDDDHYDTACALLADNGGEIRREGPPPGATMPPTAPELIGARPADSITAPRGTDYAGSRTSDEPPGDEMPLSYPERREYLGATEDVARTTETRNPDDLKPI